MDATDAMVARLREVLDKDPLGLAWAAAKNAGEKEALEIDGVRGYLTNKVLKPWFREARAEVSRGKAQGDDKKAYVEVTTSIANIIGVTIILDRANAVACMKLARESPDCPIGFAWIDDATLATLAYPVDKVPFFYNKVTEKRTLQNSSIASAYNADAYDPALPLHDFLKFLTKPLVPKWMHGNFGLAFPTLE